MGILIDYVAIYAPWIYAMCGIAALYQIFRLWNVRAERRQAVFSLERAKAVQDIQSIFSIALLLLAIMGVTYFVSKTLAQAVEPLAEEVNNPNPVQGVVLLPTPTNTPAPATPTPTLAPTVPITIVATVANTPSPAPTSPPPPPVVQASNCPDPREVIVSPGENAIVRGLSTIQGTANHDKFQYYKIEYAPAGTENFAYLGGGPSPVVDGTLLNFDSHTLPNGSWTIRLIVVDQTGNFLDPCAVTVQIQN